MPDMKDISHADQRNEPTGAAAATTFEERVDNLIAAANAWLDGTIESEAQAAQCEDLIVQLRQEEQAVDSARKAAGKPHRDAIADIQARFAPLIDKLQAGTGLLKKIKAAWLSKLAEQQRQARAAAEEAARKAQADADAAALAFAAAKPTVAGALAVDDAHAAAADAADAARRAAAAKPQMTGAVSGRASGFRTHYSAKITNRRAAVMHYAGHPDMQATAQRLADADAREMKENFKPAWGELVTERRV